MFLIVIETDASALMIIEITLAFERLTTIITDTVPHMFYIEWRKCV
jgi:hypothetical protein